MGPPVLLHILFSRHMVAWHQPHLCQSRYKIPGCDKDLIKGISGNLIARPGFKLYPMLQSHPSSRTRGPSLTSASRSCFPCMESKFICQEEKVCHRARVPSKGLLSPELNIGSWLPSCLDPSRGGRPSRVSGFSLRL